jgi:anthranilate synthase/aminodeoxychorismate synthase-like glutamine amidotransferase
VFVCDNYDSFTFNLVQYLGELGASIDVARNDDFTPDDLWDLRPDAVVISPGPGEPSTAGVSVALVRWCARTHTPLLGVCLGHQAIGEAFGARIRRAPAVMHGKTSEIFHSAAGVLKGLPCPFEATRYHSLVVDRASIPETLEVTAWTSDGVVMGVRHRELPVEGVQFHPESILTTEGMAILRNLLAGVRREAQEALPM